MVLNSKEFLIFLTYLDSNFKKRFKAFNKIRSTKLLQRNRMKSKITVLRKIISPIRKLKILIIKYINSPSPSVTIQKANCKEK